MAEVEPGRRDDGQGSSREAVIRRLAREVMEEDAELLARLGRGPLKDGDGVDRQPPVDGYGH